MKTSTTSYETNEDGERSYKMHVRLANDEVWRLSRDGNQYHMIYPSAPYAPIAAEYMESYLQTIEIQTNKKEIQ